MYNFAATPTLYPDLVNNESNLAELMALTPAAEAGIANVATIGAGWYVAHKLESRTAMYGLALAAPAVAFVINPLGPLAAGGALVSEAVGGTIGYLAKRDFAAGVAAGAVASMLFNLYTAIYNK